ncbi:hypothetical protein B9Z55_000862 [Caenorhabditis nigoni]|uniref:Ig-like domain-containing protein n=1 Tax=Caenorhabditis nigoni TaxID=1611254 RepID=A0A2G5VV62_9PELO|nr:hypothetical protein B9Z55_000862 [Caenorhabditis nigoni]
MNLQHFGYILIILTVYLSTTLATTRKHHRRSTENDPRSLGFQFEVEPRRNVTVSESTSHLLECSYVLAHERYVQTVRVEWKRDGVVLSERSSSRM